MAKIVRRVIDISDENNEKILSETSIKYNNLLTAIYEFNKRMEADKVMYKIALNKVSHRDYIFDDWHNDTFYMFRIKDTCIECELIDLTKESLKLYRLED